MNKKRRDPKKKRSYPQVQGQLKQFKTRSEYRVEGRISDPSGRGFPPAADRKRIIESIRAIPSQQRTPSQWYAVGSLLVYEACLEDDDTIMNEGNEALVMAAQADPPVPDAMLDLVWLMNLRGLPAMSLPYAKRATELLPDRRDAWRFLANTHLHLKQSDQAIACLRKAVELPLSIPSDREVLEKLESGEDSHGGRGVMFFSKPYPQQPLHHTRETKEEAIKLQLFYARQLVQLMPENDEAQFITALNYYHLQEYDKSERHLAQLFTINADHADGLCMQALIHQKKRGDLEKAAEFYTRAIQSQNDHVLANSNLAKIMLDQQGSASEARFLLEAALRSDPNYAPALSMYGNTIAAIERDYKLESEYHAKALQVGSQSPEIRFCYLMSLLQAGEFWQLKKAWRTHGPFLGRWAEIAADNPMLTAMLTIVPMILEPPSDFGDCVLLAERFNGILGGVALWPLLEQAWKVRHLLPDDNELRLGALEWFGMVAGHCDRHELALQAFQEAEKIQGYVGGASLNVAFTLAQLGRFEEAIELASSVAPGTSRLNTIFGNILRDSGRFEEALKRYLLASQEEPDFSMPITNGIRLAIELGDLEIVEQLGERIQQKFGDTQEGKYAFAEAKLALGFPSEAAEVLRNLLYDEGVPHGLLNTDVKTEEEVYDDLTIFGASDENEMFFALGLAFLKSRQFEALIELSNWIQENRTINGNWTILVAEANRYLGNHEKAVEIVDVMKFQPPPLATKALVAAAVGDWEKVSDAVDGILSPQFNENRFIHPEGDPKAVGFAAKSLRLLNDGCHQEAIHEAKRAVAEDKACGLAYVSLARAYEAEGEIELALESASNGLECIPGDPGLLEWIVLRLVEKEDPSRADDVLSKYRKHLESRGLKQLGFWLGEQVARAKIPDDASTTAVFDEAWVAQLEPQSQAWLSAAIAGNEKVSDLRLGIALYYCKIVEREMTSKLVQPFVNTKPASNSGQMDRDLKDIQICMEAGRMPGLGSIAHALGVAARPGSFSDSELLRSWRAYLKGLSEPQRTAVRSRAFVDNLRILADVRNRVAHLGDLSQEDFERVEKAVLDDRQPGSVLKQLGIR